MADQDFDIKIRTTADTAGIAQIQGALTSLGAKVQSITPSGGPPGGPEEPGSILDKAAAKIEHGIFRSAVHAIGIGVVYELVGSLKRAGEEIEKVSDRLNEQGAILLKNAQAGTQSAGFAKDEADVLKISEGALKNIETTRKSLNELTQQDTENFTSFTQTATNFSDWLNVQLFKNRGKTVGDYEAARLENVQTAWAQYVAAQKAGMDEVLRAEEALHRSYEEKEEDLMRLIEAQEERKKAAKEANDADDYTKAVNQAETYKKQLKDIIALEKEREKAADAAAKPLTKALETPQEKFAAQQRAEAVDHAAKMTALEQKRREAAATGDTERAKAIEDEQKHDTFRRDQRKEELQRYIGLQETLFQRPGESGAELTRDLGSLGRQKYEAAQAELEKIYAQQKAERGQAGQGRGGSPDVVAAINRLYDLWR